MPESSKHLDLVQCILSYIQKHYSGVHHLVTLHDLPGFVGCDKPPKIGRFRPDVYAIDAPLTRTIVGEAKTQFDLEADHSKKQLIAFLRYLRFQHNSTLVVAVPWQAKATASSLLNLLAQQAEVENSVQLVVIDDVGEFK